MSRLFDRRSISEMIKFELQGDRKWNWENDKSYPDVNSLVLLSEVFEISLDQLIKGDVEIMKEQIDQTDQKKFDMQTYREIIAFTEGKSLSEIEKAREEGKRPYQKVLLAVASGAAGIKSLRKRSGNLWVKKEPQWRRKAVCLHRNGCLFLKKLIKIN